MRLLTFVNQALAVDAITLAIALSIAEALYKFHSFTVEALAFLATWEALRRAARLLIGKR